MFPPPPSEDLGGAAPAGDRFHDLHVFSTLALDHVPDKYIAVYAGEAFRARS